MKIKIYFIEKTISFDSSDINSSSIGGSEKTLINIANELSKDKNLIMIKGLHPTLQSNSREHHYL